MLCTVDHFVIQLPFPTETSFAISY